MSRRARATTFVFRVSELSKAVYWRAARRGMTMREVARETGVDPSTFTRLKQGKTKLDTDTLVTLLEWLGYLAPFVMPRPRSGRAAPPAKEDQ